MKNNTNIWGEKNLTDQNPNLSQSEKNANLDTIIETKSELTKPICKDIGKRKNQIETKIINDVVYYIRYCPKCSREMRYNRRSNFYTKRKANTCCRSCSNGMKRPEIAAKFKGDLNPSKRPEFRKWMSENNPMYDRKNRQRYEERTTGNPEWMLKTSQSFKTKNPAKNKKLLEKRIDTYTQKLANGDYKLKNNWKTGYYLRKNGEKEWYDSSYELIKMKEFDDLDIEWTKKHGLRIPYVNTKNVNTYYIPDFIINGDAIVEVKGWIKENDELKARIAIEYCKINNMNYRFYLGEKLAYQKHLSYEIDKSIIGN